MFLKPIIRKDEDGSPYAFLVFYISFRQLWQCVSRIPGVHFTEKCTSFVSGDSHADFVFKGHEFMIDTPFSDLWVGPKDTHQTYPEIQEIQEYVEHHAISTVRRKVCDVLSLDFKSAFTLRR